MTIRELKHNLENNIVVNQFMIFRADELFTPQQYVIKIAELSNKLINDCTLDMLVNDSDMFGENELTLDVCYLDDLDEFIDNMQDKTYKIIVTKKISDPSIKIKYSDNIIEFNKIEEWMLKDYAYSLLPTVDRKNIDWMLEAAGYNIYRIQSELDKLLIFEDVLRDDLLSDLRANGMFSDISTFTIFSFTDALIIRDKQKVLAILKEIENIDIEAVGLVTVLYKNLKNIISIQLGKNPTPESTGLKPNQFAAIKYRINKYNTAQLMKVFEVVTTIDYRLKNGEMPADLIIEYLYLNLLLA